jgi:hypothetical protein
MVRARRPPCRGRRGDVADLRHGTRFRNGFMLNPDPQKARSPYIPKRTVGIVPDFLAKLRLMRQVPLRLRQLASALAVLLEE